jgi:hypothetical protein
MVIVRFWIEKVKACFYPYAGYDKLQFELVHMKERDDEH